MIIYLDSKMQIYFLLRCMCFYTDADPWKIQSEK